MLTFVILKTSHTRAESNSSVCNLRDVLVVFKITPSVIMLIHVCNPCMYRPENLNINLLDALYSIRNNRGTLLHFSSSLNGVIIMKEQKSTNKPKKTRSILSKLFGKKSSPKREKQQLPQRLPIGDHVSQCDENGNSKSKSPKEDKTLKNAGKPKKANRTGRIRLFAFRRKKDESDTELPVTPIYVELSPVKLDCLPDLISDDIYRHHRKSDVAESYEFQPSSSSRKKDDVELGNVDGGFQGSQKHLESIHNDGRKSNNIQHAQSCCDNIPIEQKQMNCMKNTRPVKPATSVELGLQDVKRARSFNSKDLRGSLPFGNKMPESNADEDDVSPSVYAGMCRKSNRMLQTVQESGTKRRLDRSFLRWNSVSDLQYQTSKEKYKAISKMAKTQNDKSISLQDLTSKPSKRMESGKRPKTAQTTSARDQFPEPESIKISKVRPSFDKALSKSEYDIRNCHCSPRSRGILAFKRVNLPNVRRTGARPVSAILPSRLTLSVIGEKTPSTEEATPGGLAKTAISQHNGAIERNCQDAQAEAEYVDISPVHTGLPDYNVTTPDSGWHKLVDKNGNASLGRTHSFQDRYSPPLCRRTYRTDVRVRPASCIEQDMLRYQPLSKANERTPSQDNCRRGGTVSRSRSRARSIAKRFNISGSAENISPLKLSVCTSNNWNYPDFDASGYCAMKPLLRDSCTAPYDVKSTSADYRDSPFHYSSTNDHNRIPHHYGNISRPYFSDQIALDSPSYHPEPFHQNIRRKLFYTLDV